MTDDYVSNGTGKVKVGRWEIESRNQTQNNELNGHHALLVTWRITRELAINYLLLLNSYRNLCPFWDIKYPSLKVCSSGVVLGPHPRGA